LPRCLAADALPALRARQAACGCSGAEARGADDSGGDAARGAAVEPPPFFALGDNPLAWDDDVLSRGATLPAARCRRNARCE
jgi:hypothetical protein